MIMGLIKDGYGGYGRYRKNNGYGGGCMFG